MFIVLASSADGMVWIGHGTETDAADLQQAAINTGAWEMVVTIPAHAFHHAD